MLTTKRMWQMGLHLLLTRQLSLAQAVVHGLVPPAALFAFAFAQLIGRINAGRPCCFTCAYGSGRFLLLGQAVMAGVSRCMQKTPRLVCAEYPIAHQELDVLRFNVVDNRSSEWGTSAFHWCGWLSRAAVSPVTPLCRYFTSALPRALLGAAPLAALGAAMERRLRPQFLSALFYVLLYSALPHKVRTRAGAGTQYWLSRPPCVQEVRFIFPVLPLFNMCAAAALARLYTAR